MSDTPRTDAVVAPFIGNLDPINVEERDKLLDHARALEREITKLKASFQQSGEARTGWLNEFDGYKLQILTLTQRLSEARAFIQRIGTPEIDRGDVYHAAKKWLEKTP